MWGCGTAGRDDAYTGEGSRRGAFFSVKGVERKKIIGERVFGALNGKCSNGRREFATFEVAGKFSTLKIAGCGNGRIKRLLCSCGWRLVHCEK